MKSERREHYEGGVTRSGKVLSFLVETGRIIW